MKKLAFTIVSMAPLGGHFKDVGGHPKSAAGRANLWEGSWALVTAEVVGLPFSVREVVALPPPQPTYLLVIQVVIACARSSYDGHYILSAEASATSLLDNCPRRRALPPSPRHQGSGHGCEEHPPRLRCLCHRDGLCRLSAILKMTTEARNGRCLHRLVTCRGILVAAVAAKFRFGDASARRAGFAFVSVRTQQDYVSERTPPRTRPAFRAAVKPCYE